MAGGFPPRYLIWRRCMTMSGDFNKRVCVCDEDEFISQALLRLFNKRGIAVSIASDENELWNVVSENSFDAIVFEPIHNGECRSEIVRSFISREFPVVIFTSANHPDDISALVSHTPSAIFLKLHSSPARVVEHIYSLIQ